MVAHLIKVDVFIRNLQALLRRDGLHLLALLRRDVLHLTAPIRLGGFHKLQGLKEDRCSILCLEKQQCTDCMLPRSID